MARLAAVNKASPTAIYCAMLNRDREAVEMMDVSKLIQEIVETYQKHGWQMRRILWRPETRSAVEVCPPPETVETEESSFDGLWFSRGSHNNREAWELRLVAPSPFALFETFEPDETEEQREEMRREMEARMREYITREGRVEVKSEK